MTTIIETHKLTPIPSFQSGNHNFFLALFRLSHAKGTLLYILTGPCILEHASISLMMFLQIFGAFVAGLVLLGCYWPEIQAAKAIDVRQHGTAVYNGGGRWQIYLWVSKINC